jgi:hypothetical protein
MTPTINDEPEPRRHPNVHHGTRPHTTCLAAGCQQLAEWMGKCADHRPDRQAAPKG